MDVPPLQQQKHRPLLGSTLSEDAVGPAIILTQEDPSPDCSSSSSSMTNNSRYKALVCWLYNLKVILPPEKFTESIFNIDIHDMICTQFHIATIQSKTTTSLDDLSNKLERSYE
jgi:hypothetical protein